jgi:hypothetical protein
MEETKDFGYVYILTNPSFRDDWVKIGKSSRPVDIRSKELDNTAVPLPYEIYAYLKTKKYNEAEKFIHKNIDRISKLRIRKGREFFNIKPEDAKEILYDCADMLDDAEVITPNEIDDEIAADKNKRNKVTLRFNFREIGLNVGDEIFFTEDESYSAIVSDLENNKVTFENKQYRLSPLVAIIKRRLGTQTPSGTYQGSYYFSYNGKTLWNLCIENYRRQALTKPSNDV